MLAKRWRASRCVGYGLPHIHRTRCLWRAGRFSKVQVREVPDSPEVKVPSTRSVVTTYYIAVASQGLRHDQSAASGAAVVVGGCESELLRGNVPSAREWLDAWAALSENSSLRCEARIQEKRNSATGEASCHRRRKRLRNQLQIMAEVIRRNIRRALTKATSISLAIDEAQNRKVVRFRADLPEPLSAQECYYGHVSASNHCISGVLGIMDCSKKHACDFEEDHAVTAVKQLDDFLTRSCRPLGPPVRRG